MKQLSAATVDFEPIEQSMRDLCRDASDYYFQKTTGKVVLLPKGVIRFLTQESVDGRKDLVTDWDAASIPVARQIILEGSQDFVRIPEAYGQPEHAWMKDFSTSIRSPKLKQKILQALHGRGACRRFKEILKEFPEESRQWAHFRSKCWKEKIQLWLEQFGILAVANQSKRPRPASSR